LRDCRFLKAMRDEEDLQSKPKVVPVKGALFSP
jgi:hypothetical protein